MTASRYALVKNNAVENIIAWDGEGSLFSEYLVIELTEDTSCSVGWSCDGKTFTAPSEPEKTKEELVTENLATARSEYVRATAKINDLNDQIEDEDYSGTTEDAVKSELTTWTTYRKKLRSYTISGDGSAELPSIG